MMPCNVQGISGCDFVFTFSVVVSEILDECRELSLDVVPKDVLWQFVNAIDLHGA